jgi:ligand-binding sensor domain-containing protein
MVAVVLALTIQSTAPKFGAVETGSWTAKDLPFDRAHGLAFAGERWIVGGLRGLAIGKPGGDWKTISSEAVRQIATQGDSVWVVYGSGAVDKLEPQKDRAFYDVFHGAAKRPWASFLRVQSAGVLVGGHGGWLAKSPSGTRETYPEIMKGQVVTAILPTTTGTWFGTQNGLFRTQGEKVERFGFAAGIPDPWITALEHLGGKLVVATASGGLVRENASGKFESLETPSKRSRSLVVVQKQLAIGTLDGAYLRQGANWKRLTEDEMTFLFVRGVELWIGSPSGVKAFRIDRTKS